MDSDINYMPVVKFIELLDLEQVSVDSAEYLIPGQTLAKMHNEVV